MLHSTRQVLPASRQILRSTSSTPVRCYPALARSLTSTPAARGDGYEKHRVQVNEPSGGTTDKSMHRPYVQDFAFIVAGSWKRASNETPQDPFGLFHGKCTFFAQQKDSQLIALSHHRTVLQQGKVCVVTGGARGIGHMISQAFMESGATKVAILDLRKEDAAKAAEEMVAKFEEAGEYQKGELEVLPIGCNVASEESVQSAFAEIVQKFGKVDCVVNSAGLVENFPATEYPTEKVKKLLDVNILGSYFVAREAAKVMTSGASIILIGSMSGVVINVPQPQTPYNFSKAAVIHMAKSLAVEWAPKGIRVNCISPGYVLTNLTKVILDANTELRDTWTNMTPMADPNDLKGAVIYLGSDASAFTTGSNML
ncbi:hypothetical protein QFC19_005015 [Naganishia cerealis]|uniref:Uncharacterized protein n=1 Tax=Naganishia cerealis TaxID=610337 RepID=A0ACC2VR85_9TREE|nr:hypothetical protein QFC19_005015 [Naganishia cerealis]